MLPDTQLKGYLHLKISLPAKLKAGSSGKLKKISFGSYDNQ
jgi:hypothetical protein